MSKETRDQWYKPNLLYNIHWRPPKKPEPPKMVVETVQFNPSVCTCGEHDCGPRYRMERRVLWTNKEMYGTNMKMAESDECTKREKSLSRHKDRNSEVIGVEDDQSKVDSEDSSTNKNGIYENEKLKIDDDRKGSENGSKSGDSTTTYYYRENSRYSHGERDGDCTKTDGQRKSSGVSCAGSYGVAVETDVNKETETADHNDLHTDSLKRNGDREDENGCSGGRDGGMKLESYKGSDKDGCDGYSRDREDGCSNGEKLEMISDPENDGSRSGCKSGDDSEGLMASDNRCRNDDDIHSGSGVIGGIEISVSENNVSNGDVCDEGDESVNVCNIGDAVGGDGNCNYEDGSVQEEETNHDDYYNDISPAFGIFSIYCNSEIHNMVQSSC